MLGRQELQVVIVLSLSRRNNQGRSSQSLRASFTSRFTRLKMLFTLLADTRLCHTARIRLRLMPALRALCSLVNGMSYRLLTAGLRLCHGLWESIACIWWALRCLPHPNGDNTLLPWLSLLVSRDERQYLLYLWLNACICVRFLSYH